MIKGLTIKICQGVYLIFEIEKVFKEMNNEDINKKFIGVFPSDKMNKFIMFEKMMSGKKHPFIISNQYKITKVALPGGVFCTFHQKMSCCFLIRSE